jgi:predicted RNA-binding protein YlxR (DUF448 family)
MTSRRPQRTCLGCGKKDEQTALLRMVIQNGELEVSRLAEGRGGYLHTAETCWDLFLRKKNVARAFRAEIGRPAKERLIFSLRARGRE